ncbi:MAG: zinc-binding metallopeptidase family protein [Limisphaerales bacterium]
MKVFQCDDCGNLLFFENTLCLGCNHQLGFVPDIIDLCTLQPTGENLWKPLGNGLEDRFFRQCQNTTEYNVCNWLVPADDINPLCQACRLNVVIPDLTVQGNLQRWQKLEVAKRRVLYSCLRFHLPTEEKSGRVPLQFKFVADPAGGSPILTGHAEGVITINIAEADDAERERRRAQFHEPFRTLVGHLRHELAHYYWDRLIAITPYLYAFRELFGDEQANYSDALTRHYAEGPTADWQNNFVSAYATAHPWEDWAETWAHYFHITDALETAGSFGMSLKPKHPQAATMRAEPQKVAVQETAFEELIRHWLPLTHALNELNRGMGIPDLYPFILSDGALAKLRSVHNVITALPRE